MLARARPDDVTPGSELDRRGGFRLGARVALSVPGAVLFASAFGFGAFAQGSNFDLGLALFTALVFALPGQVVLVDSVANGAGLAGATLAVTLTAVRLLPLTVALMPHLRRPDTPLAQQLALSHFVAVTVWVETMRRLHELPRDVRISFYSGVSVVLLPSVIVGTLLGFIAAGVLPPPLAAGLMFLTPIYFLLSMLSASREQMDVLAIGIGLVFGPIFYALVPGLDLLVTGLVAGTLAYAVARWRRRP